MDWTWWILSSAFFLALYDLCKKAGVSGNAVFPVLLVSSCAGFLAYASALAAGGALAGAAAALDGRVLALSAGKVAVVGTSWIFTFTALRTLPVSIATPIRASAPALVCAMAFFLYGERPSPLQGAGMACVFAGYFAFSLAGRREGIDFARNRAVWCAFAGAFFSALSAIWDKYVFQVCAAPVEGVQLAFQAGLVVFYAVAAAFAHRLHAAAASCAAASSSSSVSSPRFQWRWSIPATGALLAVADWLYFRGLACPDAPVSAASLVRRVSVVIVFFAGARIFHETNLARKAAALAAIVAGVVLICLG